MNGKELIKLMQKAGWTLERVKGSHYIMRKAGVSIPVPVHGNADMRIGTLNSILRKAGLK